MTDTGIDCLLGIMERLRDPESGCPWDIKQSFETIAPYTIEEAYEVADAIDRKDLEGLSDELGDLLLQVVYHARMAEEASAFAFPDVVAKICDKMVRRHPHVFGTEEASTAALQMQNWEAYKEHERRQAAGGNPLGLLDDIPLALPALMRAGKIGKRSARIGFDWTSPDEVLKKVDEEIGELCDEIAADAPDRAAIAEEIGDVLFTVANLARHLGIEPEEALRAANAKFCRRFGRMEAAGRPLDEKTRPDLEALWNDAKRVDKQASDG